MTMNKTFAALGLLVVAGCASHKRIKTANDGRGDTRTIPVEYIDDNTYFLQDISNDKTYGFEKSNPIKVGGINDGNGPRNQRRFLNALLGPNGEEIKYFRSGSCCPFKTPNGFINDTGMLDRYRVYWSGVKDTLNIYINIYDKGDLKVPSGLSAKKKS